MGQKAPERAIHEVHTGAGTWVRKVDIWHRGNWKGIRTDWNLYSRDKRLVSFLNCSSFLGTFVSAVYEKGFRPQVGRFSNGEIGGSAESGRGPHCFGEYFTFTVLSDS